jgi:glutamate synthase domain-containing protein 3
MTKNEQRRADEVTKALSGVVIPNVVLLNRADGEYKKLSEMVQAKLEIDLLEQECSNTGKKAFDWILEDFKNCQNIEDFAYYLPQSYGNNGELYYNNDYNFFNDKTEEDDLNDYSVEYAK